MVKPGTGFTKEEFDREQFERRFWFAKWCAQRRWERTPTGKTWDEVFTKKEGMTLPQFMEKVREIRKREK